MNLKIWSSIWDLKISRSSVSVSKALFLSARFFTRGLNCLRSVSATTGSSIASCRLHVVYTDTLPLLGVFWSSFAQFNSSIPLARRPAWLKISMTFWMDRFWKDEGSPETSKCMNFLLFHGCSASIAAGSSSRLLPTSAGIAAGSSSRFLLSIESLFLVLSCSSSGGGGGWIEDLPMQTQTTSCMLHVEDMFLQVSAKWPSVFVPKQLCRTFPMESATKLFWNKNT